MALMELEISTKKRRTRSKVFNKAPNKISCIVSKDTSTRKRSINGGTICVNFDPGSNGGDQRTSIIEEAMGG